MRQAKRLTGIAASICLVFMAACGNGSVENASTSVEETGSPPVPLPPPDPNAPPEIPTPGSTPPPIVLPSVVPPPPPDAVRPSRPLDPPETSSGEASASAPPPVEQMVECAATGSVVSAATCDAYMRLRPAAGAFNAPSELLRGDTVRIRFALSREPDATQAGAEATGAVAGLPGDAVAIDTRAGRHMRATLTGTDGLQIKALSEERQDLGTAGLATWDWDVTAMPTASTTSPEVLTLTTYVELPTGDGGVERLWQKVENRQIRIVVNRGQKVGDIMDDSQRWIERGNNWIIALTTLVGSLIALWFAIRKFGRKE